MYLYVHDSFLQQPKYSKILDRIEIKLISLDIKGSITKLNTLKSITESIRLHAHEGVHTVVAVGDDQTLFRVINSLVSLDKRFVVGYIPIGNNLEIARVLGLPKDPEKACDVISSRITRPFDVGKINEKIFFKNISFEAINNTSIIIDKMSITPIKNNLVEVYNLSLDQNTYPSNPLDGSLDLFVYEEKTKFFKKKKNDTHLSFKKLRIVSDEQKPISITIDNNEIIKTPAEISIVENGIKIIVGKNRLFETE